MDTEKRMRELVDRLNLASEAYYGGKEEILTNYEWDALFDELAALERESGIVLPDSPTRKTGTEEELPGEGEKEPHEYPALSLAKTKSLEELKEWAGERPVWLSWKLDGLTLVLTYDGGSLTRILTRGSGTVGTNITYLKTAIGGVPLTVPYQGHLVVRGEATISYPDFERINDSMEDGDDLYANPRNLASGTLALDRTNIDKVKERNVCLNAFTLVHIDEPMQSWGDRMSFLDEQGFTTVEREFCTAENLADAVDRWTQKVESGKMQIPVDGLVICYDDTDYAATGSVTGHHATRAGFAFKWQDTSAITTLDHIEWSCAASTITPVAVFKPVKLEGTKVSRASLCNISELKRLGIGEDGKTELEIIKANKIIPKCIRVPKAEGKFTVPDRCPVCDAPAEIRVSEHSGTETLHCTNPACPARHLMRYTRFASKTGMDIDGLSRQTLLQLLNCGFIRTFADIYRIAEHAEAIQKLDGMGKRSCEKLLKAVEKSRDAHPANFLYALCIPQIGLDAGKRITAALGTQGMIDRIRNGDGFEDLDGVGPERSESIIGWYAEQENHDLFEDLLNEIHLQQLEPTAAAGKCFGLTFVITGEVKYFANRDAFQAYVEQEGGKMTGSVSKKTSFLVTNDTDTGTAKNRRAVELGIPVLTEEAFLEQFGGGENAPKVYAGDFTHKLMVLDGNSIVNRAFYGVKPLSTRDGLQTNAIFGFLNILQRLLDEDRPDALCITFDRKEPTFRHLAFAPYKAQRKPMPEELAQQLPVLKELLGAMNIPMYDLAGWEADDLMGTMARVCEEKGWLCTLVTGDKDSLQLVTDTTHVKLIVTRMGQTDTKEVTPELFREEYGFAPKGLIDLKALMGDSSDNYPGVPGIGEKTAMQLIQTYGSVENLYDNLETAELKPAQRKKLDEGRDSAKECYDLATIRTDAPLPFDPAENLRREWNNGEVYRIFLRLEFRKMIEKYGLSPEEETSPLPEVTIEAENVTDPARIDSLIEEWKQAERVFVLTLPELDGFCAEWEVSPEVTRSAILHSLWLGEDYDRALRGLFSAEVRKVGHDVKPLMNRLLSEGLSTDGFVFDTALAAYLLSPADKSYELDKLFLANYGAEIMPKADYTAETAFSLIGSDPDAEASFHAHVSALGALADTLEEKLKEQGMLSVLTDIELPLCTVLAEMERAGILVDRGALTAFGKMLDIGISNSVEEIYRMAGHEFNINSTKQLGIVLFEEMGLPAGKKTKSGWSTNADVLEKLKYQNPIVQLILEYRKLAKLKSTYVDGLILVIEDDGRIRTTFQNTVTATGRLSSTEPNLQNIPVRTELGAEMRKMFIAGEGNVLVDADYSQIELRLLAHIADDKAMQEGFLSGVDIHTVTASQVMGVPVEQVTKQMRSSAKAVNFGIVYGISAFSLSQDIGVSQKEAKEYISRYLEKYSGVADYMERIKKTAKQDGYVTTLFGRRRPLPEISASNANLRAFGERVALNAPIQGTAADIIKLAMIRVQDRLKRENLAGRLVLQVHDELIVECPAAEGEQVRTILEEEMERVAELKVPLIAEAQIGSCWADAH